MIKSDVNKNAQSLSSNARFQNLSKKANDEYQLSGLKRTNN